MIKQLTQTEIHSKFERIQQLEEMGFNTPRTFKPSHPITEQEITEFRAFLDSTNQEFANIRTYKRAGNKESWSSEHFMYIPKSEVLDKVTELCSQGIICMVDIENPKNGIYAGYISISNHGDVIVEYCHKSEGGATVRMADDFGISKRCNYDDKASMRSLPLAVRAAVSEAYQLFITTHRKVTLEWSKTAEPCGKNNATSIWWEYRDLEL